MTSDITMGLDAAGNIVLASAELPSSARIELSARSTSVALVRLALGDSATDVVEVNAAISSAPAFAQLVAATQSALDRGAPPGTDEVVAQRIVETLNALQPVISSQEATTREDLLALPFPRVEQAPLTLIDGAVGMGGVEFGGKNSTVLFWSVKLNGSDILLEPGRVLSASGVVTGAPYPLLLSQSPQTYALGAQEVMRKSLLAVLSIVKSDSKTAQCAQKTAVTILNSDKLVPTLNETSPNAFKQYLGDLRRNVNPVAVASLLGACSSRGSAPDLAKRLAATISILGTIDKVKAAVRVASAAQTLIQLYQYWGTSLDFGVCQDEKLQITSCATRFALEPSLHLIPGAYVQPEYLAYAGSQRTGLAAGLQFSSLSPDRLEVDPTTGWMTGLRPGITQVRVLEPVSDVRTDIPINVVIPTLESSDESLPVDQFVTFTLTHPDGKTSLVTKDAPVVWTVSDESKLRLFSSGSGGAVFQTIAEGDVTVSATLLTAGVTLTKTISVGILAPPEVADFETSSVRCERSASGDYFIRALGTIELFPRESFHSLMNTAFRYSGEGTHELISGDPRIPNWSYMSGGCFPYRDGLSVPQYGVCLNRSDAPMKFYFEVNVAVPDGHLVLSRSVVVAMSRGLFVEFFDQGVMPLRDDKLIEHIIACNE